MRMSIKIEVWGDYACFTRPEMKVERVSYDVMTPSAARGLVEAIYWHPGLTWRIDKIHVLNQIEFTNLRRNEVKSKISARNVRSVMNGSSEPLYISTSDDIQQRAALILKNVRYVIDAHFEMTEQAAEGDNEGKFFDIMKRRLEKGQCYHQPCFGCREFPAHFRKWEGGEIETAYPEGERDLGFMLFDLDFSDPENITPQFFRAKLRKGVLDLHDCEVFR
ncbi:MAG: type I-C CRISPR-associated protein Cas5c [Oscillospiraceae bacterium]|nr:type I-C CRISPR-associated protein Cas5c [Oscillospiraceae bacterium]